MKRTEKTKFILTLFLNKTFTKLPAIFLMDRAGGVINQRACIFYKYQRHFITNKDHKVKKYMITLQLHKQIIISFIGIHIQIQSIS